MSETAPPTSQTEEDDRRPNKDDHEPAEVLRTPDGEAMGVAIVLTGDDLRSLGVPDSDAVVSRVLNGAILVEPAE